MRALLDANVYSNFLLTHGEATPPRIVVKATLDGAYQLLMTAGVISEMRRKTTTKPYLARRIARTEAERLVRSIVVIAEVIPELDPPLPEVGRDRKDDYLLAHAIIGEADYLVFGCTGVQAVGQIGDVRIVSPAGFLHVLGLALPAFGRA